MAPKPDVALVTGSPVTRRHLTDQLQDIIGEFVNLRSYAFDDPIEGEIRSDLIVFSSAVLLTEDGMRHVAPDAPRLVAKRIINYSNLDALMALPEKTPVLLVNDDERTALESILSLQKLGLDHLEYVPYTPNTLAVPDIDIAITPGETSVVPRAVSRIIDIGPRLIDMTTIAEILRFFNLLGGENVNLSERYMKRIVQLGWELAKQSRSAHALNNHLRLVLDGVNGGIISVDAQGKVTVFNEHMEALLNVPYQRAIGRQVGELVKNRRLYDYITKGGDGSPQLFQIADSEVVVHRFTFGAEDAVVCTFRSADEAITVRKQLQRELRSKGYVAKYSIQDIVGSSREIQRVRELCGKLAQSDLTILIEGESGTGKELLASAIHTLSTRRYGPFLAANFSALPEELAESELFGYEEGAFTGAKKGGKQGLFEQADGGTIFLDEIGDISLRTQARLLRVLQEKEIMRVGGNKIIPVDVRVIAATNRNLEQMIDDGQFRQDLYHRLKVLYLRVPPLRERKADIPELLRCFIRAAGCEAVDVDQAVLARLQRYDWFGNIRELKNTIDYMLAVCDGRRLTKADIPDQHFFQKQRTEGHRDAAVQLPATGLVAEWQAHGEAAVYRFVLELIAEFNRSSRLIGRRTIAEASAEKLGTPLSEQQIRHRLDQLGVHGLITKQRGRYGTRITPLGDAVLKTMSTADQVNS